MINRIKRIIETMMMNVRRAFLESFRAYISAHKKPVFAAFAAVLMLALVFRGGLPFTAPAMAAEVLAQGAKAMTSLRSIHISAKMRTLERDNFELIGLEYDLVGVEMWKRFGEEPKWRVEKPGRVAVMDGKSSVLFIRPDRAAKGGRDAGFVEWLKPLMNADKVLEHEIALAKEQSSKLALSRVPGADGREKLAVTVSARAQGDYSNDWCKNRSITEADNTRVYRFDAATKRLEAMQVYVEKDAKRTLVFEITAIEYDKELDDSLFTLKLPKAVVWRAQPASLGGDYAKLGPAETAQAFFKALANKDWGEAARFYPYGISRNLKNHYGGLEVLNTGKPFKSGLYPGYFVPYEIICSGRSKKWNLAVRNDNPAKRFIVDGGI
ncbi:MAG: hypothetical protein HY952_01930 [Elusimicrobia bacterium]|nr:hypothetical protein [Elusimicrobiota bacterium]